MLDWALEAGTPGVYVSGLNVPEARKPAEPGPVMIRYPKALCPPEEKAFSLCLEKGRGVFIRRERTSLCLAFTGSLFPQARDAAGILAGQGIEADLYNLRFLKPVDEDYLADVLCSYETMFFIEEGMKSGGFGEYAAELAAQRNCSARLLVLGVGEGFKALGRREELLRWNGLDGPGIADAVRKALAACRTGEFLHLLGAKIPDSGAAYGVFKVEFCDKSQNSLL
jgi:1-deoxy-D-xylulose-5-phosphate synthase